jgi:hypothetical protein
MAISLLFTGHMIDKPDRPDPRFPAALEEEVRDRIARAIAPYAPSRSGEPVRGFASAARGGDILFHERCRAFGIPTAIVLPFPPETFLGTSVRMMEDVDRDPWVRRFQTLWGATPRWMREVMDLPIADESYRLCNIRLVSWARQHGRTHLIAFWDGKSSGGPGGTADMVAHADAAGEPDIFSPQSLKAGH